MSSFRASLLGLVALCLVAAGCGFQPLYGERSENADLAAVKIALIQNRSGQELHNALLDRLNPKGQPVRPLYVLRIALDESLQDLAVRKDESVTRANLQLAAIFRLYSQADGSLLTEGVSRSTTSFNISTQEYSAIVAEQDARRRGIDLVADDIQIRLALFFRRLGGGSDG
ncbi:MAG: hypothetical protein HOH66_16180 [Rhodospirillaceae bacterium]|jgi:LPS-assembly lipoprotein|nr:hypothetical protein [Rhodospirillaceae bacterium]MBT6119403.1 hypothetical protein [Rhodospirillaceae bacterium]